MTAPKCGRCQADLTAISAFYSSTALAYETFMVANARFSRQKPLLQFSAPLGTSAIKKV
nr:MAG TPA: Thioredoxin-like [Caudoviricetes sp.]